MALKDELPEIAKTALHEESKSMRDLVRFLLKEVMITEGKTNQEQIVKSALFDEVQKMYESGLFKDMEES
jgi:hypothetical protein